MSIRCAWTMEYSLAKKKKKKEKRKLLLLMYDNQGVFLE